MAKTEDEIAREKDMVQKMVGAKSAMDAALSRIDRLQKTIERMVSMIDDVSGAFGETLMYPTYQHGENSSDRKPIAVKKQMARIAQMGRDVK